MTTEMPCPGQSAGMTGPRPSPSPEVLHRVDLPEPLVALTFDDCDAALPWIRILDVLQARSVRASFFPLGIRVLAFPDLARRTVGEGHTIGSHGFDHARLSGLAPEEVRDRVQRDVAAWQEVAEVTPAPLVRPPYGDLDERTARTLAEAGFHLIVLWDVDPEDWTLPGAQEISRRVVREARPGSIVVLHVVDQTAEALPGILDGFRDRGLEPVTLDRLLEGSRA